MRSVLQGTCKWQADGPLLETRVDVRGALALGDAEDSSLDLVWKSSSGVWCASCCCPLSLRQVPQHPVAISSLPGHWEDKGSKASAVSGTLATQ